MQSNIYHSGSTSEVAYGVNEKRLPASRRGLAKQQ
jgi:hypothetical protein